MSNSLTADEEACGVSFSGCSEAGAEARLVCERVSLSVAGATNFDFFFGFGIGTSFTFFAAEELVGAVTEDCFPFPLILRLEDRLTAWYFVDQFGTGMQCSFKRTQRTRTKIKQLNQRSRLIAFLNNCYPPLAVGSR